MKRDGALESLWQQGEPAYKSGTTTMPAGRFDVIIIGGGITGVTTGLELQKRGKKCLLLEAQNLCFGTTGGTTAHLNSFFDTTYDQISSDFGEEGARLAGSAAT